MPQRIDRDDIAQTLEDAGHHPTEYHPDQQAWDPGYRAVQRGPRWVLVFHEGPGSETDQLRTYTTALRAAGYHVQTRRMAGGTRHRLEATRP